MEVRLLHHYLPAVDEFLSVVSGASLCHSYQWTEMVARIFRHTAFYLVAYDGSTICGVLPLERKVSAPAGRPRASLCRCAHSANKPFCDGAHRGCGFESVLVAFDRMHDARFGRALIGIRENEGRMESLGYPTFRFRLMAFAVAGGVAGLAGALFANHNLFVSPSALHWTQSATFVVMVILGGIGYRYGGVLGAPTLLLLEEILAAYTEFWHLPLGVLLLAVVFLAPHGLSGWLARRAAR